jgi:hypothetical protein
MSNSPEEQVEKQIRASFDKCARDVRKKDFLALDRRELMSMDDKALADWQAKYPSDSAQFILAQYEWSRRLTAEQIRATMRSARWQAWFGIAATIIGALLGMVLTVYILGR